MLEVVLYGLKRSTGLIEDWLEFLTKSQINTVSIEVMCIVFRYRSIIFFGFSLLKSIESGLLQLRSLHMKLSIFNCLAKVRI